MSKSICIKTNNEKVINYLLNKLEIFELDNVCFSHYKFKAYNNIIIHFTGKNTSSFFSAISDVLTNVILEFYEKDLLKHIFISNYFYFSLPEQTEILKLCLSNADYNKSFNKSNYIFYSLYDYFESEKTLNIEGFIVFRLTDYIRYLDSIVDICVNKFILDREYLEFIDLLKTYINSKDSKCDILYLIYKNQESIILDNLKNCVKHDEEFLKSKIVSDITFSSNDFALNILLTLIPKTLYIDYDIEDEFVNTIKTIFAGRILVCKDSISVEQP